MSTSLDSDPAIDYNRGHIPVIMTDKGEYMHAIAIGGVVIMAAARTASAQLGMDLIVNGNFEMVTPDPDGPVFAETEDGGQQLVTLDGWSVELGRLTLDRYEGQFPPTTGPVPGGEDFYLLGRNIPRSVVFQVIDLGFAQTEIDTNRVRYNLAAHLGSFYTTEPAFNALQDDIATVRIEFLADGDLLRTDAVVGPSQPDEVGLPLLMGNFLTPFTRQASVPPGSTHLRLTILLDRDTDLPPSSTYFNNACVDLVTLTAALACSADLDNSGLVNFFDIVLYLQHYNANDPRADLDASGTLNFFDIAAFLDLYAAGCL